MKTKVAVGISGGVDSALSPALLKKAGYDVIGVYLHCFPALWEKTLDCTDKEDFKMAQEVAKTLDIPFTFFDFEKEYQQKVIEYFFKEYQAGRTPNPDAVCNKEIKFGLFLERATRELGVDFVATGHYARIVRNGVKTSLSVGGPPADNFFGFRFSRDEMDNCISSLRRSQGKRSKIGQAARPAKAHHLLAGVDPTKDQSYFLYNLSQKQLSRVLFPIGEYTKKQVRQMARDFGLPNWDRKDSQGICFLGKVSIRKFLEQRIKPQKGEVVDTSGRMIGEHDGVWFYTIGQRHGFKVNSKLKTQNSKLIEPLYVVDKNIENNRLIVGWGKECERREFKVEKVNWINGDIKGEVDCTVRIRHLGELYPCQLITPPYAKASGGKHNSQPRTPNPELITVRLSEPAWGVAPGQVAVFYDGEEVLGGGVIS